MRARRGRRDRSPSPAHLDLATLPGSAERTRSGRVRGGLPWSSASVSSATVGSNGVAGSPRRWDDGEHEDGDLVRRRSGSRDELGHLRGHDRGPELGLGRPWDHGRLPAPHRGPGRRGPAAFHHGRVEDPRSGRVGHPDLAGQPDGARRGRRRPGLAAARLPGVAAEAGDRRARDDRRGRHRVLGVPAGRGGQRGPARSARAENHRQRPAACHAAYPPSASRPPEAWGSSWSTT